MAFLAIWFAVLQQADSISSGNSKLLMIFIGLVALAMVSQAVVQISFSIKAAKSIKGLIATVEELKGKALPLLESAKQITATAQRLIDDTEPKVKAITDNLLETSEVVRNSAKQFDKTVTDANMRTQRQVARVDGMVTAALATTAEVVDTVTHGIRVPAQKIALLVNQAWGMVEGLVAKGKSLAAGLPFGQE